MLSKLIKHEWKATWKLPAGICLFEVIMTIAGCMVFRSPMWQNMAMYGTNDLLSFTDILGVVTLITYFISLCVGATAVMVYFAYRYYKNLYSDEGYLTHTLPVTPRQLIISKTLINTFWTFAISTVTVLSVFILIAGMLQALGGNDMFFSELSQLGITFDAANSVFKQYAGITIPTFGWFMFVYMIISCFSSCLLIYLSISIGQLFKKHKIAAAIAAYLVVTSVVSILSTVIALPITFRYIISVESVLNLNLIDAMIAPFASMMPLFYLSFVVGVISAIVCHIGSEYIMTKKLNLD